MSCGQKAINKIRSKSWIEPTGVALCITASILEGFNNWAPGRCLLGGALTIGSSLLNPESSFSDLTKQSKAIEANLDKNSTLTKNILKQKLEEIRTQMKQSREILQNWDGIIKEVSKSIKRIARSVRKLEDELVYFKNVAEFCIILTFDSTFSEGNAKVEQAFQNYFERLNNPSKSFIILPNIVDNIEMVSPQNVCTDEIFAYLQVVKETEELNVCEYVFRHSLVVQLKYLLLHTIYYILRKDCQKITQGFETFNCVYTQLLDGYQTFFGDTFNPGQSSSLENKERFVNAKEIFQEYLKQDTLHELQSLFKTDDITISMLMTFAVDDLDDSHQGLHEIGNRLKILQTKCRSIQEGNLFLFEISLLHL